MTGKPLKSEFKRIIITAALPYANGKIHLGHLAGAYLPADIYARYQRSMKRDILFISGSDEHGVPITITAEAEKTTPQAVVDRYHGLNKAAFEKFGMSFDNYSRTSLPLHHTTAREFFMTIYRSGVLKEKKEQQLYDEKAGMFLPDRYVEGTCPVCHNAEARGDQCEKCGTFLNPTELIDPRSKITGARPSVRETSHLYFPLGDFQKRLEDYIREADRRDRWKENVLRYCQSWFTDGLKDRAVTRDLEWGVKIPLPGFEHKVLYVWFDAVLGYISSTMEWARRTGDPERWRDYWCSPSTKYVAFIGKDNVVFHCIVFPSMLMAWNEASPVAYILPENVPANEFLNFEGQKFSKSRGWGIDVDEFLAEFPADTLRYTLAMNMPENRDSDFSWKDFAARTNNELADILGNFVNRTLTFIHRNFRGLVPARGATVRLDQELLELLAVVPGKAGGCFERYRFRDGALEVMNLARFANKYFNDSEPWKLVSSDRARCGTTLNLCLEALRSLAILSEPVIPEAASKMWRMLSLEGTPAGSGWQSAGVCRMAEGQSLGTPEILFMKIEDTVIQQHIAKLPMDETPLPAAAPEPVPQKATITIDQFRTLDLRVARVIAAEPVAKSQKLLKLQIRIGVEERQVVAGIAQHYKPEQLIGKAVIVVTNLEPAKLMGQESRGMLLAANASDGKIVILTTDGEIPDGSIVK